MIEKFFKFFSTNGFMPHGMCLSWKPSILWSLVISNLLITLAYTLIPIALGFIYIKRRDFKFNWIFLIFALFIILCGITHLIEVITFWKPIYGIASVVEWLTALVSLATAVICFKVIPKILSLPTITDLEKQNYILQQSQASLHEEKEKNLFLINSLKVGIYVIDSNGDVTFTNKACCKILGYKSEELIGKNIHELVHYANEDGSVYPKSNCPEYYTLARGKSRYSPLEMFFTKMVLAFM